MSLLPRRRRRAESCRDENAAPAGRTRCRPDGKLPGRSPGEHAALPQPGAKPVGGERLCHGIDLSAWPGGDGHQERGGGEMAGLRRQVCAFPAGTDGGAFADQTEISRAKNRGAYLRSFECGLCAAGAEMVSGFGHVPRSFGGAGSAGRRHGLSGERIRQAFAVGDSARSGAGKLCGVCFPRDAGRLDSAFGTGDGRAFRGRSAGAEL
jgi:hypothetical protein